MEVAEDGIEDLDADDDEDEGDVKFTPAIRRLFDEDEDVSSHCQICLDGYLNEPVCALKCGHVYHSRCFQDWLLKGAGDCPQCKAVSHLNEIRDLTFLLGEVPSEKFEFVVSASKLSAIERLQYETTMQSEMEEAEQEVRENNAEASEHRDAAKEQKRLRLEEIAQEIKAKELEIAAATEQVEKRTRQCASLRNEIQSTSHRRLPIAPVLNGDADLIAEKKKLQKIHPIDRIERVHEDILKLRQHEQEARRLGADRTKAAEAVEEECRRIRQQRSLSRRPSEPLDELSGTSSQVAASIFAEPRDALSSSQGARSLPTQALPSSSATLGVLGLRHAPGAASSSSRSAAVPEQSIKLPPRTADANSLSDSKARRNPGLLANQAGAGANKRSAPPADEDDFLYGSIARRGAGNLLTRGGFGSSSATAAVASAGGSAATIVDKVVRRPNSMKALFAQRKA